MAMGLADNIADAFDVLMGRTRFERTPSPMSIAGLDLDDPQVVEMIRNHGGRLARGAATKTRWYSDEIETAERLANAGNLAMAAQLMKSARKDGVYSGMISTRTSGLVRLPKRFRGNPEIVDALKLDAGETRSVFDQMFPASELAALTADGVELGVGVAELKPVPGRKHPVMIRLDPEFLRYDFAGNQWLYHSVGGILRVTPGDGRWILHLAGGRLNPWQSGIWRAIGRAYVRKEHAQLHKDNWEGKLANPARVAIAPNGAAEEQRAGWFAKVAAWGVNTVFGMTPGYDVKLVESNGRGHESFSKTIEECDNEIVIATSGQTVTTDGGAGFSNSDIHKSIRADLIKASADSLAETINTQGLPRYIANRWGIEALYPGAVVEWDVTPAKDRNAEADALGKTAQAVRQLVEVFSAHDMAVDVAALAVTYGVPMVEDGKPLPKEVTLAEALKLAGAAGLQPTVDTIERVAARLGIELEGTPDGSVSDTALEITPSDAAKIVTVKEGRESMNLPAHGDERDEKTIAEAGEQAEADADADADIEVAESEGSDGSE